MNQVQWLMVERLALALVGCLALAGTASCTREHQVDEEHCKCANAGKDAAVGLSESSIAPPKATPSSSASIDLPLHPFVYNLRITDSCADFDGSSKREPDRGELERQVSQGNACAAVKLAGENG